ncbi:MAG TPA: GAF domain-containing protein, partial [Thermoanaerobaculia bacterium]|nr:GAF domain-containing protein [Thermoanaerobaculia bacterium]
MPQVNPESAVAEALRGSRNTLGASRARFYLMTDTGDYRLAASYGFVSRFGPEEVLTSGHPLVEWVQHHRRPAFVNSPAEAGQLGDVMERDHYAHSLTAPVYQGSRMVGILELQDRLGGAPFGWEDIRRVETAVQRLEAILGRFDPPVAQPDPLAQEDQEALFLADRPASATQFPAPPDLFSADAKGAVGQAERPAPQAPPAPPAPRRAAPPEPVGESGPAADSARQESRVLKGFFNTLLLNSELDAVVFSSWTRDLAEITIAARGDLAPPAMAALV